MSVFRSECVIIWEVVILVTLTCVALYRDVFVLLILHLRWYKQFDKIRLACQHNTVHFNSNIDCSFTALRWFQQSWHYSLHEGEILYETTLVFSRPNKLATERIFPQSFRFNWVMKEMFKGNYTENQQLAKEKLTTRLTPCISNILGCTVGRYKTCT